jgi:hypothetical protein
MIACCNQHCKGFPEEFTDYLPYKQGQIITFVNEYGDTLSAKVENTWKTNPYVENACKGACGATYGFVAFYLPNIYEYKKLEIYMNAIDNSQRFEIICTFQFNTDSDNFTIGQIQNEIDNIIMIDNEQVNRIEQIEIHKGKGIISFSDENLNYTWELSENN